ncbi:MAG TPA: sigma-70 family RNA polymerase sigma factor [Pseudonocardiaceae bacterium]|jgi:RNA polymerase sigma-70 factor (ECF subfamily)|nr:sigma-70 family RNA polymerase sigma factor [Pseudonocardiaceae bacterium]
MPTDVIDTGVGGVDADFVRLADPFRRELFAHCYRMVGSVHDAEDLVQETYLRAWRAYDRFEGRSSLRTWLHRIATSACLTALEGRARRPLPTGLGAPNADPDAELVQRPEVPWLEPIPQTMVGQVAGDANDPAAIVSARASVRLALIAALQHLSPRQRAVLILRDVLKWRAAEVADLLETTTASVNSLLQRAHAQLDRMAPAEDEIDEPETPAQRALLDRYVRAFEGYDFAAIGELLTENTVWEMPPFVGWYRGTRDIVRLSRLHCPAKRAGDLKLLRTQANGQPAFALYLRDPADGRHRAFSINVLAFNGDSIAGVVAFFDTRLFPVFDLPPILPAS